jgi:hypothetical protein
MTIGDTFTFSSRPINESSREVNVGDPLSRPQNIGLHALAQRRSNGLMVELNIYCALMAGLPLSLAEKAYSEAELAFKAVRSIDILTGKEGIYSMREVHSSNS